MIKQFQIQKQHIAMFVILLALVVVIAKNVNAGTCTIGQYQAVECSEDKVSEADDAVIYSSDLPWSPFLAFLVR